MPPKRGRQVAKGRGTRRSLRVQAQQGEEQARQAALALERERRLRERQARQGGQRARRGTGITAAEALGIQNDEPDEPGAAVQQDEEYAPGAAEMGPPDEDGVVMFQPAAPPPVQAPPPVFIAPGVMGQRVAQMRQQNRGSALQRLMAQQAGRGGGGVQAGPAVQAARGLGPGQMAMRQLQASQQQAAMAAATRATRVPIPARARMMMDRAMLRSGIGGPTAREQDAAARIQGLFRGALFRRSPEQQQLLQAAYSRQFSLRRPIREQPNSRARVLQAVDRMRQYNDLVRQYEQQDNRRGSTEVIAQLTGMAGSDYKRLTRRQVQRLAEAVEEEGQNEDDEERTYFDRLRRVRDRFRQVIGNRNTRLDPGVAGTLAYYDLAERMALMRNSTIQETRNIPVSDFRMVGRLRNDVDTPAGLAQGIVNCAVRNIPVVRNAREDDLVSFTVPQLPVRGFDGNTYMLTVFTGSMPGGARIGDLILHLADMIDELMQSSEDIDWDYLYENDLQVEVQYMGAPRAGGWSPRVEVEEYFVKNTVRYIPPEMYLTDSICIPIAVLAAGLRVTDEKGEMTFTEYEEVELGGEDEGEVFTVFDTREPCNQKYYQDQTRFTELRAAAVRLMEEAGVTHKTLCIDTCESFAFILGVQIHVIFQEVMCRRMLRFGDVENPRSLTILIREDHAFPVIKPWRLSGNGAPSLWCDACHTCVTKSWTQARVCHHRVQCPRSPDVVEDKSKYHGREYVHRRFNRLYHKKHNVLLNAPYCFTCESFCYSKKEALKEEPVGIFEDCMAQGHNVMDNVGMGECCTCHALLPVEWPAVADAPGNYEHVNRHKCYIPEPELKVGEASKYYVWDIETIAVDSVHVPIYVYARNLYNEAEHYDFTGMDGFCKGVIHEQFKDSTWIAHNSGGFDSNFVHSWLEDRGIMHTRIPSPMSVHRSLETVVDTLNIRFIDSYSFIPMSLAKIGPSFNLPVCKGDFPHKFSQLEHMHYEGPMPPCDTDDDWYSLREIRASSMEKASVAVEKFKTWHAEESRKYYPHTEARWKYQDELRKYCKQDCDVLAGALQCLRDSFMAADSSVRIGTGMTAFCLCPVDPLCYLTMAQVCQQLYIAGLYKARTGFRIAHIPLPDRPQIPAKVKWLMEEEAHIGTRVWKASTHLREWILDDGMPVDGYAEVGGRRHVWEYYDCLDRGCVMCTSSMERNSKFGCVNRDVYSKLVTRRRALQKLGYVVHERWSHEEADAAVLDVSLKKYDCMVGQRQRYDGGFYGGRVEVFKPMWRCREEEKIQYIDVVSLYPWVCATQRMCTGFPEILVGGRIDVNRMKKDHTDAYFGYAHVRVRGCPDDYFGGLPRKDRETGRLVFDNSEYTVTCFITELHERVDNGAELLEVYEVWHWDEANSVEGPMAGYVAYFLRDKMECSGWKALCGHVPETDAEKETVCDQLEKDNLYLCRPRPEKVQDNPGGRQLAKLRLNMLWGKFVQTPTSSTLKFINSYEDYVELWYNNHVNKSSLQFRRVHDYSDFMEVKYSYNSSLRAPSNTHYYLGGSCTAQARLKLTRMLRRVGKERALYCDTDSVVYVQRPGDEEIETGEALGQWSSELDEGVWGEEFLALAPKCYLLNYNDKGREKEKESGILKTKGVTLTVQNLKAIHADNMRKIILTEVFGDITGDDLPFVVQAKTFNIRMNHAGDRSMTNMHGEKVVRCVYSKRKIQVPDETNVYDVHFIDTVPFC